jgi:hypothetical protein
LPDCSWSRRVVQDGLPGRGFTPPPNRGDKESIQSVRQETRDVERKRNPDLPPYRPTIAMREFVHYQGTIRLAFDLKTCPPDLIELLLQAAPAINYLGKRGSFLQYLGGARQTSLDPTFTQPAAPGKGTILDDFGPGASFSALNSFSSTAVKRSTDRKFVETIVPLAVYNSGPGFVHYSGDLLGAHDS